MLSFFGKKNASLAQTVQPQKNIGVERGVWGEETAVKFLRSNGWKIVERNVRPFARDYRKEIDVVAYIEEDNMIVFVEVKAHKKHSEYAPRSWGVDRAKKRNLLTAFRAWLRTRKWAGNYRFDIIEIYGDESTPPEIDHIINVPIFPASDRFYRYG
jgi:putative endonuclease